MLGMPKCATAVVSTSKMLSVICLDDLHLWAWWIHLLEYLCRSKQIAVVMILQSQLHKVNGRSASGDLTMRPLSSTVEEFGNEDGPARSKTDGDRATFHHNSLSIAQAAGDQSTSTSVNTKWDTIRATG